MLAKQNNFRFSIVISLLCVIYMSLYSHIPIQPDLYLAMPIAKETAFPGLYSKFDLIVQSGLRAPFYFYRIVGGFLYKTSANPEIIWHYLYLLSLFVYFFMICELGFEITKDALVASLLSAFLAIAPMCRGGLHSTFVPLPALLTAQVAVLAGIFVLLKLFRRKNLEALVLSSFIFNIHPYVGIILLCFSGGVSFVYWGQNQRILTRKIIFGVGASFLIMLPSLINIIHNMLASSALEKLPADLFFNQFKKYSQHVFMENYWNKEYVWFLLSLIGSTFAFPYLGVKKNTIQAIFRTSFILMVLYVINTYFLKQKIIAIMFLFRVTYFLKPLIFLCVIYGVKMKVSVLSWRKDPSKLIIIGCLFISAVIQDNLLSDIFSLIGYGYLLNRFTSFKKVGTIFIIMSLGELGAGVIAFFSQKLDLTIDVRNVIAAINILCAIFGILTIMTNRHKKEAGERGDLAEDSSYCSKTSLIALVSSVLFVFYCSLGINALWYRSWRLLRPDSINAIKERVQISEPTSKTKHIVEWIKKHTPRGSLFLIPPTDWDFADFRCAAERGVFAMLFDVNQLAFDMSVYREADSRLREIGVKTLNRLEFEALQYNFLSKENLIFLNEKRHVDYAVFYASDNRKKMCPDSIIYADSSFLVFDLKKLQR